MQIPNITKDVIEQKETDAGHDTTKHVGGDAARAKVQISKRQSQHHHDQTAQGVKNLFPELDFVALRSLRIDLQMPNVLKQVNGTHALRLEQRC
ncbi:MAG: hypothetical protein ACD_23C01000G0005 [uncultured bacterium]|nr:MAG: hypothetical protein ACD_23C01000G0005 [uncultured bacterium]